jgi:hypothetical protein
VSKTSSIIYILEVGSTLQQQGQERFDNPSDFKAFIANTKEDFEKALQTAYLEPEPMIKSCLMVITKDTPSTFNTFEKGTTALANWTEYRSEMTEHDIVQYCKYRGIDSVDLKFFNQGDINHG